MKIGYIDKSISDWTLFSILTTNFNGDNRVLSNITDTQKSWHSGYFIPDYNPELFLAIAAMTDSISPIAGEWIVYTDSMAEMLGLRARQLYRVGKLNTNTRYMRKATLQELIEKFTNQKQDIMKKELTQEQFEELKNLIAPENKEKFNKLFKVNKNAIKEDLDFNIDFGTPDIFIAAGIFGCDINLSPFRENYRLRSLLVNNNIDIHIVEGSYGDKLIMFNEKD